MKEAGFHHGNLRSALIDAGIAAVRERGAAAVSLRDLAREAGVSPTAAYRHFADKSALFAAIAERGFQALATVSERAMATQDPRERLFVLARAYTGFAADEPQLYRLMFSEPLDMATVGALSTASVDAYRPLRQTIEAVLGAEADEAEITDALVRVWSVMHGYVTLRLADRLPRLATREDRFDQVFRPVIAAL